MMHISGETGTDGRSTDRGERRKATRFQNICDVSMHNSVATGYQSQFKPAEASENSKHSLP